MEFPRYADYAQSFPATIPFSESLGFMLDINDETVVDMAFYVTAHEVAHQCWGMQVEAANVQGQHMILETLAQYSALMVLRERYSEEKVQQFLELQLESYNKERLRVKVSEPSLALVENQDYVYYSKGAIIMYTLQEQLGAERVNLALRGFIADWNTLDGTLKKQSKRYPTTKDLLGYFYNIATEKEKHFIKKLF